MTDFQTPKFPPIATPEEVKAASEKVMNFWVGALSPMWVPFWAASSFGLSAWAATQSLAKGEGLMKDMPMAGKWPGFDGVWGKTMSPAEAEEAVEEAVAPVAEATEAAEADVAETLEAVVDSVVDATVTVTEEAGALKQAAVEAVEAETAETAAKAEDATPPAVKPVAEKVVSPVRKSAAKKSPKTV
ncbi:MAG: hypothetical protein WBQ60_08890 [Asticcacaulis sp.]